jgi:hypothetical protein
MAGVPAPFANFDAWLAEPKAPIPLQSARFLASLIERDPRDGLIAAILEHLARFVAEMADDDAYRDYRAEVVRYLGAHARWRAGQEGR